MSSTPIATYEFAQLEGSAPRRVEDVLSAAWAEAEEVRARARAEGYAAGRAEALADFAPRAAASLAALGVAASELNASAGASATVLERQAAELALAIAEQVLAGAVAVEPERVVDVARSALRRLIDRQRVTVAVHPDDLELLAAATTGLSAELGGIERMEIQADRRIERGGASVHTEHGEIDATIATQLSRARDVVMESLRGGDASR